VAGFSGGTWLAWVNKFQAAAHAPAPRHALFRFAGREHSRCNSR
jgi:hypothetical protein